MVCGHAQGFATTHITYSQWPPTTKLTPNSRKSQAPSEYPRSRPTKREKKRKKKRKKKKVQKAPREDGGFLQAPSREVLAGHGDSLCLETPCFLHPNPPNRCASFYQHAPAPSRQREAPRPNSRSAPRSQPGFQGCYSVGGAIPSIILRHWSGVLTLPPCCCSLRSYYYCQSLC